ncbi:hypothetical protein C8F01DRAFT_1132896 [Mycena amicta]|nr:hypothetical protein C8F01DRAFT_1132896 [Mycena amicta]
MAYNDNPYAGRYGAQPEQPYGQQQYGHYDPAEFNPYVGAQPHATYEQGGYDNYNYGGYRDEPDQEYRVQRQGSYSHSAPPPIVPAKSLDETSRFDAGEFTPTAHGPKTASNLREFRRDFQGNIWTKGGRGSCFFRFFCCTLLSLVFIVVILLLALVLWLRPPSIDFGDVAPITSTGSTIQTTSDGIIINMGVNISVHNPNYFAVKFKKITADIFYPINNTDVGGGTATNIVLSANQETNFTFPFSIDYSTSKDPTNAILLDLAKKCGILGTPKSDLTVDYKIKLGLQFLFVTLSPTISNSFTFTCPLDQSDLSGLLNGAGIGGS